MQKADHERDMHMNPVSGPQNEYFDLREDAEGTLTVFFRGRLDMPNAGACLQHLTSEVKARTPRRLAVDLGRVTRMDDYGAMVIMRLMHQLGLTRDRLELKNTSEDHRKTLSLIDFGQPECDIGPRKSRNFIVQLGDSTISALRGAAFFTEFIGAMVYSTLRVAKRPGSFRINDAIGHMKTTGVDALPVVGLISLLLGLIIAFMSSLQLSQFGANLYVASLVGLAMVSELGPIMTAIIVSGRSGSAYAAEISTMKITEEIDALSVMGFDPNLFLVMPRMIAAMVVVPLLTVFSSIFAIAGGLVIGVTVLDLSPAAYIGQTVDSLTLFELMWGLSKSLIFAVIIALTGCLRGFQARGGASAVGNAATSAVVTSIFLIILFDSIFAVIRSFW
ncbi:MAG: MlaE family lipid ABC transporter permease subunit [Desulfobacteraceae bacterium]|nr:MlaE family lipid ABC transporter permease subunit [Desulfobacteraceae bacterium]